MLDHIIAQVALFLGHITNQVQATARRISLQPENAIGGALLQTEAAVHTAGQVSIGRDVFANKADRLTDDRDVLVGRSHAHSPPTNRP